MGLADSIRTKEATMNDVADAIGDYATIRCGTSTGSSNAFVLTPDPAIASLVAGMLFSFVSNQGNTGASTANVNGTGATSIVDTQGNALTNWPLSIVSGGSYLLYYDGTNFVLLNPSFSPTSWSPTLGVSGGTFTGTAVALALFATWYEHVFINIRFTGTTGSTVASLTFSLPFNSTNQVEVLSILSTGAEKECEAYIGSATNGVVRGFGGAGITDGAQTFYVTGWFRRAT